MPYDSNFISSSSTSYPTLSPNSSSLFGILSCSSGVKCLFVWMYMPFGAQASYAFSKTIIHSNLFSLIQQLNNFRCLGPNGMLKTLKNNEKSNLPRTGEVSRSCHRGARSCQTDSTRFMHFFSLFGVRDSVFKTVFDSNRTKTIPIT